MATLAIPIDQLAPVVVEAKRETKSVVESSHARIPSVKEVLGIAIKTFTIRQRLFRVVRRQTELLDNLTSFDFTASRDSDLLQLTAALRSVISDEREIIKCADELGSEIRFFWQAALIHLSVQIEHLDSIVESLSLECDPEASMLLAAITSEMIEESSALGR